MTGQSQNMTIIDTIKGAIGLGDDVSSCEFSLTLGDLSSSEYRS